MIVSKKMSKLLAFVILCGSTASCSFLPAFGPSRGDIYDSTGQEEQDNASKNPLGFRIVDISPHVTEQTSYELGNDLKKFSELARPRSSDLIFPGDILSVSIFEAGQRLFGTNSQSQTSDEVGILSTGSTGAAGSETIPRITVTRDGTIFIPYAGRVNASERTTSQLATDILTRLKGKASQPQVMVERIGDSGDRVVVLGDVQKPGRYALTLARERLLDVIAEAAGPTHPARETKVILLRQGKTASALLSALALAPAEDVILAPGDRIELNYDPRTFLVFGAAGRATEVPFDTEKVSLAQGLSRVNGLQDFQADPRGVFVFRLEDKETAAKIGQTAQAENPGVPIIYHANLDAPANFFLMRNFQLKDKDIVYISDAPSIAVQKLLGILNGIFSPVATTRTVAQ